MRLSSFKKGGGFLNNVTGRINSITFTDTPPGGGAAKEKEGFVSLFGVLAFQADGADEPLTQHLWAGNALDFEISSDGTTLTPVEDGNSLRSNSTFGKFYESLVTAGFDETLLPEEEINFDGVAGARVTIIQVPDESMKGKKRKDKKDPKKEYDYTIPSVSAFLGMEASKKGAKGKSVVAAKSKKEPTFDVAEAATEVVLRVLEAAGGELKTSQLRLKALTDKTLSQGDKKVKDAVVLWLTDSDNHGSIEGTEVSKGVISLA